MSKILKRLVIAILGVVSATAVILIVMDIWRPQTPLPAPRVHEAPAIIAQPSEPPPPPTCRYDGDTGGYASRSKVYAKLDRDASFAFLIVANSKRLCFEPEGPRVGPNSGQAIRVLAKSRQADEVFKELVATATPAGQLYGLIGLYYTDRGAFTREAERLRGVTDVSVDSLSGDLGDRRTVAEYIDLGPGKVDMVHGSIPYWALGRSLGKPQTTE